MSRNTADLTDEELRRYRSVLRKFHELKVDVFDMRGRRVMPCLVPKPDRHTLVLTLPDAELRLTFFIGDETWVETHAALSSHNRRARNARKGGWETVYRYEIPLP